MRALKVLLCLLALSFVFNKSFVFAQYNSGNYKVNEYLFGSGGDPQISSPNYLGSASLGANGVGDFSSANYRSNTGFLTQDSVFLEESVTASSIDLGTLSTTSTGSGSGTFSVKTYVSQAYSVIT